jgi:hypothetical protein
MKPASHAATQISPMLIAFLIYLAGRIRRRLKRAKDTMSIIVDAFADMQQMRRTAQRQYPYLDI